MGRGNESFRKRSFHMTKMAAMPIYGKNLKKSLDQKADDNHKPQPTLDTQEEEKKDKIIKQTNKQINVREAPRPAPSSPSEVIRMLKQTEKTRTKSTRRL